MPFPNQQNTCTFLCLSLDVLLSTFVLRMASVVPFPGMKPNCALLKSTNAHILLSNALSIIFMSCSSNFTSLYEPQFIASAFPLKIGPTTLAFHSSGIPFPTKTRWQSYSITNLPLQFCHLQQSSPLLFQRTPQPFPVSSY